MGRGSGGGGGNLAIYYKNALWSGGLTTYGGRGANTGAAGVIYLQSKGSTLQNQVILFFKNKSFFHPACNSRYA